MRVPSFLQQDSVTIESYLGDTAYGPNYGPPEVIKCFLDDARKFVRDANGEQVVSETTIYIDLIAANALGTPITAYSRVDIGTRKTTILSVKIQDTPNLPTPNYLELSLK